MLVSLLTEPQIKSLKEVVNKDDLQLKIKEYIQENKSLKNNLNSPSAIVKKTLGN